jgi:hypothetical protein
MQASARASVAQFSWSRVASQVYDVYDALVDEASCLVAQ